MIWPEFQTVVDAAMSRILNSLPEGVLIALFVWATLRFLPTRHAKTRFAVWFATLVAVVALPAWEPRIRAGFNFVTAAPFARTGPHPWIGLPAWSGMLLSLVWIIAAGSALLQLIAGLWRLRSLRRSCTVITSDLEPLLQRTVAQFAAQRKVTIARSPQLGVPAAIGFFRPMIVIPDWAFAELPPEELNVVLLHEFAHLCRWDDWTNLLQKIMRALFIVHPAVWWIESRLSLEREMACDEQVLARTANPKAYAKCLIALLEKSVARRGWSMAQAAVRRSSEAALRLARILDGSPAKGAHVWKPALGMMAALFLSCVIMVPGTGQFVAFAPSTPAVSGGTSALAASSLRSSPAVVVPVALRAETSSRTGTVRARAAVAVLKAVAPSVIPSPFPSKAQRQAPRVVAASLKADASGDGVSRPATQSVQPGQGALLVLRTTEHFASDSSAWSITVWRVILIESNQEEGKPAPVAKKT